MYKFNKITELLELQNKTQKELTKYIGVTEGVFSQWKSGQSKSYEKKIDKIADFFEVDISEFFEQKNSSPSDLNSELIEIYKLLGAEGKAKLLEQAQLLREAGK